MIPLIEQRDNINWQQTRGIVPIYKPVGCTSHDVVGKIRRLSGEKRVGHGGTLDPLADGVLIIGIGRSATKQLDQFSKGEKTYETIVYLGSTSETLDGEGPIRKTNLMREPTQAEVETVIQLFHGDISQIPPQYSALKIHGVPAYTYARRGENVELKPRTVHVSSIQCTQYVHPNISLAITCSGGTYIRAIARDIGEKLGTGAYMKQLTRTHVGNFSLSDCLHLPINDTASPFALPQ